MSTPQVPDDLVLVPVPRRHLLAIYRFLGEIDGSDSSKPEVEDESHWTVEELMQLSTDGRVSYERVARMLDHLAKTPGQAVGRSRVTTATGLSDGELQGALSGFSRSQNAAYGVIWWPMEAQWSEASGETEYTIDAETARRWIEARRRTHPKH